MEIAKRILEDREKKVVIINQYLDQYNCLCLKANVMGSNKNIFESFFLINYFEKVIDKVIKGFTLKKRINSYDGPYLLYFYKKEIYPDLKEKAIQIEEENNLGRLIDLDVYYNSVNSVSRGYFRKCLICDEPAIYCNKLQKHSYQELIKTMDNLIINELVSIVEESIDYAIEKELLLPYKFGCVCVNDSGSHCDMDSFVMRKAKEAIIPHLIRMFKCGFEVNDLKEVFKQIRLIGIEAEKDMYSSTNGVNCYKGLIFLLGLLVSSFGYYIKNQFNDFDNIFKNIKEMCINLKEELTGTDTYGLIAYKEHQFKGARHEAIDGLVNVKKSYEYCNDLTELSLEKTLIKIINDIDDTVMLKRAKSIEKYNEIKTMIKNIKSLEDLISTNNYCIKENISVGGACDILICVIFLKLINEKINISGENYA